MRWIPTATQLDGGNENISRSKETAQTSQCVLEMRDRMTEYEKISNFHATANSIIKEIHLYICYVALS